MERAGIYPRFLGCIRFLALEGVSYAEGKAKLYHLVRLAGNIRSEMVKRASELGADLDGRDPRQGIGASGELGTFVTPHPGAPRSSIVLKELLHSCHRRTSAVKQPTTARPYMTRVTLAIANRV
jgi:hypothetical protein